MTQPDYRHIVLVIDRSGSMTTKVQDTEGGIAQFLADQGAATDMRTTVSLYQFDNEPEAVYEMAEIGEVSPYTLVPRGSTALLDALGYAITRTGQQLAALPEDARPAAVVLVAATDGEENASREYTLDQIKQMITHQQECYRWTVVFLAADLDAVKIGASIGVAQRRSLSYAGTASAAAFAAVSDATTRSGLATYDMAFTDAERASALGQ